MKSFSSLTPRRIVRFARLPRLNIFLQHYAFLSFYFIFDLIDDSFDICTCLNLLWFTTAFTLAKYADWFFTWLSLLHSCLFFLICSHLPRIQQSFFIGLFMILLWFISAMVIQSELGLIQPYFLATCYWIQLFILRFAILANFWLIRHWFMLLLSLWFFELRCTY